MGLAVVSRGNDDEIDHVVNLIGDMQSYQRRSFAVKMFTAFNSMRGPKALKLRRALLRERRRAGSAW